MLDFHTNSDGHEMIKLRNLYYDEVKKNADLKQKTDAVIEYVNNKNSQGCFEYVVYSEIFEMLNDLKKG